MHMYTEKVEKLVKTDFIFLSQYKRFFEYNTDDFDKGAIDDEDKSDDAADLKLLEKLIADFKREGVNRHTMRTIFTPFINFISSD